MGLIKIFCFFSFISNPDFDRFFGFRVDILPLMSKGQRVNVNNKLIVARIVN